MKTKALVLPPEGLPKGPPPPPPPRPRTVFSGPGKITLAKQGRQSMDVKEIENDEFEIGLPPHLVKIPAGTVVKLFQDAEAYCELKVIEALGNYRYIVKKL